MTTWSELNTIRYPIPTLRDIRTITDTDGSTYEVADIVKPGAILPLSIPLYEYFDADWEAKADAVYCWLCAADATDRVPYPVEIKAKVDLVCDRYENEFMVEADGCGNDSDLWDWSRGG